MIALSVPDPNLTITNPKIPSSSGVKMLKIFPAWHILWHLHMIPRDKNLVSSPSDHRRATIKRYIYLGTIQIFFLAAFLHEGVIWLRNQQLTDLLASSGNRLVLLLTCSRSIITLLHICVTINLFLWRCPAITQYTRESEALLQKLDVNQARKRRHRKLLLVLFFMPVFVASCKIVIFLAFLASINWKMSWWIMRCCGWAKAQQRSRLRPWRRCWAASSLSLSFFKWHRRRARFENACWYFHSKIFTTSLWYWIPDYCLDFSCRCLWLVYYTTL